MTTTSGQGAAPQMTHTLPPLPYAFDALEPYIDAKTTKLSKAMPIFKSYPLRSCSPRLTKCLKTFAQPFATTAAGT
jgi:hypothetical protein